MNFFNEKKQLSTEFKHLLFDKAVLNKHKTIVAYLKAKNEKPDLKPLKRALAHVETLLLDGLEKQAWLQYRAMELAGNWGPSGEQQVKLGFYRNILQLPNSVALTYEHMGQFETLKADKMDQFGLTGLSAGAVKVQFESYHIAFLGKQVKFDQVDAINAWLRFIGSKYTYMTWLFGAERMFFVGEVKKHRYAENEVVWVKHEKFRSPNLIVALAAVNASHQVFIREEALRTIFYQKWVLSYDLSDFEKSMLYANRERAISDGIKEVVFQAYGVSDREALIQIENEFVFDMGETIQFHELGHSIVQHDLLPKDAATISEVSNVYTDSLLHNLAELLADLAPHHRNSKGPLANMVDLSKTDPRRAARMFYMYLSDVWFYDTQDAHMLLYSDLIVLFLLRYIKPNKTIDFAKLEADLVVHKGKSNAKPSMIDRILDVMQKGGEDMIQTIKTATFVIHGKDYAFEKVKQLTFGNFQQDKIPIDENSYKFLTIFWRTMLSYMPVFAVNAHQAIQADLDALRLDFLKKMMVLSCGKTKAEAYGFDHRRYIFETMEALGITVKPGSTTLF
ncbi:MAG: hypothetical protein AB7F28_08175 [Candidatus Margulisiibacteriota bacterium]